MRALAAAAPSISQAQILRLASIWVGAFLFFEVIVSHLVDPDEHAIDSLAWSATLAMVFVCSIARYLPDD